MGGRVSQCRPAAVRPAGQVGGSQHPDLWMMIAVSAIFSRSVITIVRSRAAPRRAAQRKEAAMHSDAQRCSCAGHRHCVHCNLWMGRLVAVVTCLRSALLLLVSMCY